METRTIYNVERIYTVYDKEDVKKEYPIDNDYEIMSVYESLKEAENLAGEYSKAHTLEFPLQVRVRNEYRDDAPTGMIYREGMGWHLDHDYKNETISQWWEGQKQE